MTDILELGVDINNDWSFKDGDIQLVSYKENIIQAIHNRLNTEYDSYNLFYNEYGSFLHKFHGWKRLDENLRFMEKEIQNTLHQDPRLQNISVRLEYVGDGKIVGRLDIVFDEDTDLSLSMVLNNGIVDISDEEGDVSDGD